MNCKNCYTPIEDLRKETKCTRCNEPLHKDCAIKDDGMYCDTCYLVKGEDKPAIQIEIPESIRRTYIELYRSCPYKFLKTVIEGHEPPPTIYTQLGIDLHEIFEDACLGQINKEESVKRFYEFFHAYDDSLFENEEQRKTMEKRALDSLDTFFDVVLPTLPQTPFTTEETIRYNIGENIPDVEFTMDRVDEVDGELELHDWKTGNVMVGQKLSSDLQAPLYIYGVREHFKRPVRKFTFYYLKENKVRVFERSSHDNDLYICRVNKREYHIRLTDAIREVKSLFSRIMKGDFNIPRDTRKMHFTCKMCHLREQGLCRGADEESWYVNNQGGGYGWM